jgi:hypothetical protein
MADYPGIAPEDMGQGAIDLGIDQEQPQIEDPLITMQNVGEIAPDLRNFTPETVDSLVNRARITPEQGAELKSRIAPSLPEVAPNVARQQSQQMLDTAEGAAMKGTGINPSFALQGNVPSSTSGLPSTLRAPQKSPEQMQAEADAQALAAQRDAAAQAGAQEIVAAEKVKKQIQVEKDKEARISAVDNQVKEDTKDSPFWRGLGDAIAIMMGAYSQGLTGGKENPGLKAIENRIAHEVEKRKYNAEQEAALRKLATDAFDMKIKQAKMLTDNAVAQASLDKMAAETQKFRQEAGQAQNVVTIAQKREISEGEVGNLALQGKEGKELAEKYVPHPFRSGAYLRATSSPESIGKLRSYAADVANIPPQIDQIIAFARSPEFTKLSPEDRGVMRGQLVSLIGKLRLPFTGPGPLLEAEYKRLESTIGNPNQWLTLNGWETKKLDNVKSIIKSDIKNNYKSYGNVTVTDDYQDAADKDVQALMNRGLNRDQAEEVISRRRK